MSEMKKMIQVGTGGFGVYWLESIIPRVSDFARLVAAVDVKAEALKNAVVLAGLPKEKCYTDLRRALKENKADFVNVVVPPEFHEAVIDEALEAGMDIVCEKPLGKDMEASVRIRNKVKAAGRKLAVTMSHRFEVEKQTVEALARSGAYGEIDYVVSRLTMARSEENHGENKAETLISSALIHNMDTVRGICGCNAKTVYANCWTGGPGSAPSGLVIMEMENGVRAVLEESFANGTNLDGWSDEYLRVECREASIEADHRTVTVRSDRGYPFPKRAQMPLLQGEYWDHALIIRRFVEWLEGGSMPVTEMEDNLQCCALTYGAIESIQTGKAVDVQEFYRKHMQGQR